MSPWKVCPFSFANTARWSLWVCDMKRENKEDTVKVRTCLLMWNEAIPSVSVTLLSFTAARNLAKRAFSQLKSNAQLQIILWEKKILHPSCQPLALNQMSFLPLLTFKASVADWQSLQYWFSYQKLKTCPSEHWFSFQLPRQLPVS